MSPIIWWLPGRRTHQLIGNTQQGCGRRPLTPVRGRQRTAMPPCHLPAQTAARFRVVFGPAPIPYAMAIGAGFSRESLRSALRRGLLVRPRHGYLAVPGPPEHDDVRTPT